MCSYVLISNLRFTICAIFNHAVKNQWVPSSFLKRGQKSPLNSPTTAPPMIPWRSQWEGEREAPPWAGKASWVAHARWRPGQCPHASEEKTTQGLCVSGAVPPYTQGNWCPLLRKPVQKQVLLLAHRVSASWSQASCFCLLVLFGFRGGCVFWGREVA